MHSFRCPFFSLSNLVLSQRKNHSDWSESTWDISRCYSGLSHWSVKYRAKLIKKL